MGIPDGPQTAAAAQIAGAERLARLVLRMNELVRELDGSLSTLPARGETPFLHSQLDELVRRVTVQLRQLAPEERAREEKGMFSRLFSGPKKKEATPTAEARYDLEGNAWTIPVTELVNFLSHSGKSGLLWVTSKTETFVLQFARGNLVHATTNNPPELFRLGSIVVREGLLTAGELEEAVAHARAADDLLGSFLERSGRLTHAELQRVLTIQVQEMFHRLMDADSAIFRFQDGAQLLRSQSLEVNITSLLLESARKKDETRQAEQKEADALAMLSTPDQPEAPLPKPEPEVVTASEPVAAEKPATAG